LVVYSLNQQIGKVQVRAYTFGENCQTRIKSFGRFLESGRFPKGGALWSPSAEGEIPQPPDRMHKDWTKTQTIDSRQEYFK